MPHAPSVDTGAPAPLPLTLLNEIGTTTLAISDPQINNGIRVLIVIINTTAIGSGSLTPIIQGQEPVSGLWFPILSATSAITTNTVTTLTVIPGAPSVAGVLSGSAIPTAWRVLVTANNSNPATYTVSAMAH